MIERCILLDSLKSLSKKRYIIASDVIPGSIYLEGSPFVGMVFDQLLEMEYIRKKTPPKENIHKENISHYEITPKGERALAEGVRWYKSLSILKRLCAKNFIEV